MPLSNGPNRHYLYVLGLIFSIRCGTPVDLNYYNHVRPCNTASAMYAGRVARVLSSGESRSVCTARSIKVTKKTGQTDRRRTDGRQTVTSPL